VHIDRFRAETRPSTTVSIKGGRTPRGGPKKGTAFCGVRNLAGVLEKRRRRGLPPTGGNAGVTRGKKRPSSRRRARGAGHRTPTQVREKGHTPSAAKGAAGPPSRGLGKKPLAGDEVLPPHRGETALAEENRGHPSRRRTFDEQRDLTPVCPRRGGPLGERRRELRGPVGRKMLDYAAFAWQRVRERSACAGLGATSQEGDRQCAMGRKKRDPGGEISLKKRKKS